MTPSTDEVHAQLEQMLASETFANAGRLSRLLRYLVERALAGSGDQLKEYSVGVDVFDRGDTFDPRLDSIVRVEARRLRARLDDYYAGPGARDEVVISIPRGNYTPVFASRPIAPPQEVATAPAPVAETMVVPDPPAPRMASRWAVGALAIAVVLVVIAMSWRSSPGTSSAPQASMTIRVAVLPFAFFSPDPEVAMLAARITDGVTTELARLGTLSVVSRTSAAQFLSEQKPVSEVAQILECDFVMEGSTVVEDGRIKVVARLIDGTIDRKVWVGEYDSAPHEIERLQARIASEAGPAALKIAAARQR